MTPSGGYVSEWTAKRLNALPAGTIIESDNPVYHAPWYVRLPNQSGDAALWGHGGLVLFTEGVLARAGSIRIVSVPIDALLGELPEAEAYHPSLTGYEIHELDGWNRAVKVMRAAIAHVTGDLP